MDWTGPSWRQGRISRQNQRRIGSGSLRRPLVPLGNGTTRNFERLLIGPLRRRRRPKVQDKVDAIPVNSVVHSLET